MVLQLMTWLLLRLTLGSTAKATVGFAALEREWGFHCCWGPPWLRQDWTLALSVCTRPIKQGQRTALSAAEGKAKRGTALARRSTGAAPYTELSLTSESTSAREGAAT